MNSRHYSVHSIIIQVKLQYGIYTPLSCQERGPKKLDLRCRFDAGDNDGPRPLLLLLLLLAVAAAVASAVTDSSWAARRTMLPFKHASTCRFNPSLSDAENKAFWQMGQCTSSSTVVTVSASASSSRVVAAAVATVGRDAGSSVLLVGFDAGGVFLA
jgi:hypothetical protein